MDEHNIKIIDFDECTTKKMRAKGYGGVRGFVTTKEGLTYVVKPENLNQVINEVVGQIILGVMGLKQIEYAFIKIIGKYFGATRYMDGLKRIMRKLYPSLTKNQKIDFMKHRFLNYFMVNTDINGEIYLTKEGKVVSLDYGEAGIDLPILKIDEQPEILKRC